MPTLFNELFSISNPPDVIAGEALRQLGIGPNGGSECCLDQSEGICKCNLPLRHCGWFCLFMNVVRSGSVNVAKHIWDKIREDCAASNSDARLESLRYRLKHACGRGGKDPYLHLLVESWSTSLQTSHVDDSNTIINSNFEALLDFFVEIVGVPIDQLDSVGQPALIHAAYANNVPAIRALLSHGAFIDYQEEIDHMTALDAACISGSEQAAFYLLGMGDYVTERLQVGGKRRRPFAKTDLVDMDGWTSLHTAASHATTELIKALLDTPQDCSTLEYARVGETSELVTSGFYILDALTKDTNETALILSIRTNTDTAAELLIAEGADVNVANNEGETSLLCAVQMGNWQMCKSLLDAGADGGSAEDEGSVVFQPLLDFWKNGNLFVQPTERKALLV